MHPLSILNPSPKEWLLTYVASWFSLFLSSSLQVSVRLSVDQSLYPCNDVTWREVQVKGQAREINLRSGRMMLHAKPFSVVRIDLSSSLRAMEPAIIVISSDEEDRIPDPLGRRLTWTLPSCICGGRYSMPRQDCMRPRPSIVVVAGGSWWRSGLT